ncbi:MAG: hypothetical protein Fur0042_31060 [Cyanophyceae cyanobacterium]
MLGSFLVAAPAIAQPIAPAVDGTGTEVQVHNGEFDITGGTRSPDGQNLFHSFERFGLGAGQAANFWVTPDLRNVLGRVTGGEVSTIDGTLRVLGGDGESLFAQPGGYCVGVPGALGCARFLFRFDGDGAGVWPGGLVGRDRADDLSEWGSAGLSF